MRVLIVDDDVSLRTLLCRAVRACADGDDDHQPNTTTIVVDEAGSVAEAITKLQENGAYDIVISDEEMPDGRGRALLKRIRAASANAQTRCVLMSGGGREDVRGSKPGLERDAYEQFFEKPNGIPALVTWVSSVWKNTACSAAAVAAAAAAAAVISTPPGRQGQAYDSTTRTVVALDGLRRAARELNVVGQASGRDDLVITSLLLGELATALGSGRVDSEGLTSMLDRVSAWTAAASEITATNA